MLVCGEVHGRLYSKSMSFDLDRLTMRFCRELAEDSGGRPMQWRSVVFIGARCRIRSPGMLNEILGHAVNAAWVTVDGAKRVALTEEGLNVMRETPQQAAKRYVNKSRLSS